MSNIGYATLIIIPTARGISRRVQDQIISPVASAGRTAGDRAGEGIRTGVERTSYRRAGAGMVAPVTRAGHRAGRAAGEAIEREIESRDYEATGRDAGGRWTKGFAGGLTGITAGFRFATTALGLFVTNASHIATGFGLAARIVRGFSAATFVSALALQSVARTGLTKLAGALRIIAAIASRVANEIGQITSAFLVLQGVVKLASFLTNFGKRLAIMTVGAATAFGVISGLGTMIGGALSAALSAGVVALGAFAGAAVGLGGPALAALKVGMKGLSDAAGTFTSQFKDADDAFNTMVGKRMGPMLTAVRTLRMEMVDRFSAELTPAFQRIGVGIDQVRGKMGWMSVYMGQIGQDIAMSLTGPETIAAFQRMGDASGTFFQHLNKGESGLGGLSAGLVTFASTAATTFADSSSGLNDFFLDIGEKLRGITPEQIRGALSRFSQIFENISNIAGPLVNLFLQMGQISAKALAPAFAAVGNALREATPAITNMGGIVMPGLSQAVQNLAPLIPRLVEAFTPWATTLSTFAPHLATLVSHLAPLAPYLLMAATAFKIGGAVMLIWNAATFTGSVAQGVFAAATHRGAWALRGNTIALAAHRIALIAGATAAWIFGTAMKFATGPIGLIILAVAAVAAALWAFFTKTEVGKRLWEKIWPAIKNAVAVAWQYLQVAWAGILAGLGWIGEKAAWLWNAVQPVFRAIGSLIADWWTGIVQPAFSALMVALGWLGEAISWWWTNIVVPAFTAVSAVISWWWNNIVGPAFVAAKIAIGVLADVISWWWTNIVQPAFSAAGAVISWWWENIVSPAFAAAKIALGILGDAISWWWTNIVQPAFSAVGAVISWWWENIVSPAFAAVTAALGWLGDAFSTAGDVIGAVFGWIGDKAGEAKDWVVEKLTGIVDFFTGLPDKIRSATSGLFDGIKSAFQTAINWLIGKWNNFSLGFEFTVPVVNSKVSFRVDTPDLPLLAGGGIAGRTSAGRLWGPGTPTSDSILGIDAAGIPTARVSTDEGVVSAAAMAAGGEQLVAALNAGWTPTAADLAVLFPGLHGYATGGKVSRATFLSTVDDIEGATYAFGGWGNGWTTDCSGAIAKASNLIAYGDTETGGRFGTGTMATALADRGATTGLGGTDDLNFGWMNGGPYGGHGAGSLPGGIGFEMGGQRGNGQYGGAARKANDPLFTDHAHFAASMFTDGAGVSAGTNAATSPSTSDDTGGGTTTTTGDTGGSTSRLKTFDELGSDFATIFRKGALETFGLENGLLADFDSWAKGDTGDDVRTTDSSTGTSSTGTGDTTSSTPSSSTGTGTGDANTATPADSSGRTGSDLYSYDISSIARELGLGEAAAIIGNAVGLVETELKMYANSTVPESLSFPHDAVGSDSDSLGVMQQRASWGSVADRMSSPKSARLFFNALADVAGWESMDPGAAAQAVQRSAFPDKYAARMDDAAALVRKAGLFDTGGYLMPGGIAVSALTKPEPLLPADKWAVAESNISAVDQLLTSITANGSGGTVQRGGDTYNAYGYTAGDIATEWNRRQWARTGGRDGRGW